YATLAFVAVDSGGDAATEIGGVEERRACSVQLRHVGVTVAAESSIEGVRRGREVGRPGSPHHTGIACTVHRNAIAFVVVGAAEIGGEEEYRTCGVQLRYEGVLAAAVSSLECARRGREAG